MLVNPIECVACSLHRQRRNIERLIVERDGGYAGGDANTEVAESTQFLHHAVDLLGVCSLQIQNRLRDIKHYHHFLRRQEWVQRSQGLGVFDACTGDLGEPAEEVSRRGRELATADEPTVVAKSLLDAAIMKDVSEVRAMDVFPIPLAPMRAIGGLSAKPMVAHFPVPGVMILQVR